MTTLCRVYPYEVADGPANMALDEALLDEVASGDGSAALRTYGWSSPTLSLGYFQEFGRAAEDPRWRGAPIVRRSTGGGAIWHDREVTYALAVPASHPLARRAHDLYRATHGAIAALLRGRGVPASRRGEPPPGFVRERPFLCFTDRNPEDIVSGEFKLVGSSQRRRSGAVLQHGSVLLSRSDATPGLPGAGDLAGVDTDAGAWSSLLGRAIPEALGWLAVPSEVPEATRRRAEELRREVYGSGPWTRRR